jgi:pimeloyl-ACP methyl ester carboxylesterase
MATVDENVAHAAPGGAFREHFVEADGFMIRYLEAGTGEPVVYLHGGGGLHLSPAHDLLAERFHTIAFELPGFGRSPETARSGSLDELAETIAQAIAAVGHDGYTLFGTSFGGAVALRLALAHPDRVRALVLESPAALRPEGWSPQALSPEELRAALFARPENAPAPEPPEVIQQQLALLGRLSGPNQDPELIERMRTLALPVLVLFGTRDGLIPPELAPRYRQLLVNCNVVYVYDAAHEMQFDRPDAVASVVGDFVDRQEAFVVNTATGVINP